MSFFYIAFQFGCTVLQHKDGAKMGVFFVVVSMEEFLASVVLTSLHQ